MFAKRLVVFFLIFTFSFSTNVGLVSFVFAEDLTESSTEQSGNGELDYEPDEVIIKYKESKVDLEKTSGKLLAEVINENNSLVIEENFEEENLSILKIESEQTVHEVISTLEKDPNIEYVEPNYTREISAINSDDTHRDFLWALDNIGQTINGSTGTIDSDVDAPEAWNISEGSDVVVAVIDIGVDYTHPDLAENMWDGANCKSYTGEDLGDCIHGYDFQTDDKDPFPTSGQHGTHVSGIIGATKDNSEGVIGIAPNAKIMAIKFALNVSSEVKAIDFAIQNGVKIINASFAGVGFSQAEYDAIQRFKNSGGIFVASAGNCGSASTFSANGCTSQNQTLYPASYDLSNIISVGATDQNDNPTNFSNSNINLVDVSAPGVNIYSTVIGNNYGYSNGTSMSAPFVSGLTALVWGYKNNLSNEEVKGLILNDGDSKAGLADQTLSGKRINAQKTLFGADILYAQNLHDISVEGDSAPNYATGSKSTLQQAIDSAVSIKDNPESTEINIAEGVALLDASIETFLSSISPEIADLSLLIEAITNAQSILESAQEGTEPGQYATGSKAILEQAISDALLITSDMPQETVDTALIDLNTAVTNFQNGIVPPVVIVPTPEVSTGGSGGGGSSGGSSSGGGGSSSSGSGGGGGSSSNNKTKFTDTKAKKKVVKKEETKGEVLSANDNLERFLTSEIPVSEPKFIFNNNLTIGSVSLDVKELQKFLNKKGFIISAFGPGSVNNETETFGSLTQSALARYQNANGIVPTSGYFGPLTRAFINAQPNVQTATSTVSAITTAPVTFNTPQPSIQFLRDLTLGSIGDDVKNLQTILIGKGYIISTGADGYFGSTTQSALIQYQKDNNITPAFGYFGPITRSKI